MTDMHNGKIVVADQKLTVTGALENGLAYEAGAVVLNDEGVVKASSNSVIFEKTNSYEIYLIIKNLKNE